MLSASAAAAKVLGSTSSPCPTAAKFIPPPAKAAENAPDSFHVSGPTHPAMVAPATAPPMKLPPHAARYAIRSGLPAWANSFMCVPMMTSTMA